MRRRLAFNRSEGRARARISRHVSNWSVIGLNCYEGKERGGYVSERHTAGIVGQLYMEMTALEKKRRPKTSLKVLTGFCLVLQLNAMIHPFSGLMQDHSSVIRKSLASEPF